MIQPRLSGPYECDLEPKCPEPRQRRNDAAIELSCADSPLHEHFPS
jgi:hypothetical protein